MKTDKPTYHQEQEVLKKDAPSLFSLDKTEGFTVPEGYFENLAGQLRRQALPLSDGFEAPEHSLKKLENAIFSKTTAAGASSESDGFNIPDAGFPDRLEEAILLQTTQAGDTVEVPAGKGRVLKLVSRFAIAAAAAVFIWLVATPLFQPEKVHCKTFSCLLKETELTNEELLMLYDEEVVNELLPDHEGFEQMISEDEAMEYLLDAELELNDLLENETL